MPTVEFTAQLNGEASLALPPEIAAQLPKEGRVRVIVMSGDQTDDEHWRAAAYEQFLKGDAPEDAVYDSLR